MVKDKEDSDLVKALKSDNLISFDEHRKDKFIYNEDGSIKKLFSNLKRMILKSKSIEEVKFNEFTQEIFVNGNLINDSFLAELRYEISERYYMDFTKDDILQMLNIIAKENSIHPIKEMIESKEWDGTKRAETLFIDYLGADDNEYIRAVTRKWLAGAVARIYQPGIKFEMVPILQGKQGIGKSTIADKLGGSYFVDSLKSLGNNKDDYQMLIGAWIVELGELSSFNDTKIETMKSFISAREDKIRLPYDKITQKFPRTCVFIGTTNPGQYLKDATGNRRFFPMPLDNQPLKDIFKLSIEDIQQIWAEAYHLYVNNEQFFLNEKEESIANEYRSGATEENLLITQVEEYLSMNVPTDWNKKNNIEKRSYYDNYRLNGFEEGNEKIDRTTIEELAYVMRLDINQYSSKSNIKQIKLHMNASEEWIDKVIKINGKSKRGFLRK